MPDLQPDFWIQFFGSLMGTLGGYASLRVRIESLERAKQKHAEAIETLERKMSNEQLHHG